MDQPEDVEVILTSKHRYNLHSNVLARNSPFFADLLIEANAAKLAPRTLATGKYTRWMFQLRKLPNDDYPAGQLALLKLNHKAEPINATHIFTLNENGKEPTKFFEHYESLLYAFYGKDLAISNTDMMCALQDAISILQIAEYLGCVNVISKPIDAAFFKHGQVLFRAIQTNPRHWADLALKIKSEMMFKEAIVHLSGSWNAISYTNKATLGAEIRAVCEKHHNLLMRKRQRVESLLASTYPGNMAAPSDFRPVKREDYAKDILVWMALGFFRHWFAQQVIMGSGAHSPDGGFALYSRVAKGGDAYMDKDVMGQFNKKFPVTKKAMNVLENHLAEMKIGFQDLVQKQRVLDSNCQLDVHRYPVPYLTCVELDREDYPWLRELVGGEDPVPEKRPGGNQIVQENLAAARRYAGEMIAESSGKRGRETGDDQVELDLAAAYGKKRQK
ncbi:uncharacterized protein BDR25DRAFT_288734 [Lindgomyces ingoldianus]|uniref:Uncharacterized protein n=1 Tax=Lindgomyces ingoldianus TaxID=673940 RepID=A0ACB6QQI3_9PLEO|nr:uncharacterized protein BDR25DRAFT_288734 [Lindgomyces ingoldianus]KAF2469263.1 hypothetical protein BDR25DRAFT_288734 [Lindgomyces ingoldianus]